MGASGSTRPHTSRRSRENDHRVSASDRGRVCDERRVSLAPCNCPLSCATALALAANVLTKSQLLLQTLLPFSLPLPEDLLAGQTLSWELLCKREREA